MKKKNNVDLFTYSPFLLVNLYDYVLFKILLLLIQIILLTVNNITTSFIVQGNGYVCLYSVNSCPLATMGDLLSKWATVGRSFEFNKASLRSLKFNSSILMSGR